MDSVDICVINLERSVKRKDLFLKFNKHLNNIRFFKAIDGKTTTFSNCEHLFDNIKKYDDNIGGTYACWLSHVLAMNTIKDMPYMIVCEDDARFPLNFYQEVDEILKLLENKNWDIIQLFSHIRVGKKLNDSLIIPEPKFQSGVNTGMVAYILSKSGADKLTNMLLPIDLEKSYDKNPTKNSLAIDHYYKSFFPKLNIFIHTRNIVKHADFGISDRLTC